MNEQAKGWLESAQLNKLYIDARYPADLGLLPDGKPSIDDAQEFYNYTKDIYGTVTQFIK